MVLPLIPPLGYHWRSGQRLAVAWPGGDRIYGVTPDGRAVALRADTGAALWITGPDYLTRLAVAGRKLFTYRRGQGLVALTDLDEGVSETPLAAITPCDDQTPLTDPVPDLDITYLGVQDELWAVAADGRRLATAALSRRFPHGLHLWKTRLLLALDGRGQVKLLKYGSAGFTPVWGDRFSGLGEDLAPRPCLLVGERAYVGANAGLFAVSLAGDVIWQAPRVRSGAVAAWEGRVYAAGGGLLWSVQAGTGALEWSRCWLHPSAAAGARMALLTVEDHLYAGHLLAGGARADLLAVRAADGFLVWQAEREYAGLPLLSGDLQLVAYGTAGPAASMVRLPLEPAVHGPDLGHDPRLLRGPEAGFAGSRITLRLKTRAQVTIRAWSEGAGAGEPVVNGAVQAAGEHSFPWHAGRPLGFGDTPSLGRLTAEITETAQGLRYTVAAPLPVNTMPDIVDHWASASIETMLYHKYVGGYPDLTFRPDSLVTRAESAAIIAKTLGLSGPSAGFRTQFTDIAGHWAELSIQALEERGIVSGFREPDGTYTYRPSLEMTRAQEARILVKAYDIPAAPDGFRTRFTDIRGHWAEADIKALEAEGHVTGFREADGTYTYRPERFLTRAELCVMVVRIRRLTRGVGQP